MQCSVWLAAAQLKSPEIESTISRLSTASVTRTLSASEKPVLWTSIVNVLVAPPAVTVSESNVFVTVRTTFSVTDRVRRVARVVAAFGSSRAGRGDRRVVGEDGAAVERRVEPSRGP